MHLGTNTAHSFCWSQPRWFINETSKLFLNSPSKINIAKVAILFTTQALIEASRSGLAVEKELFRSTRAAFFLGVPHRGLHTSALTTMVRDQANERLISDLNSDSQYLESLHSTFCELFQKVDFRTISIYETKLSNTVEESICYTALEY